MLPEDFRVGDGDDEDDGAADGMAVMMMILVANGLEPRQDKSFESDLICAQIVTEVFKS